MESPFASPFHSSVPTGCREAPLSNGECPVGSLLWAWEGAPAVVVYVCVCVCIQADERQGYPFSPLFSHLKIHSKVQAVMFTPGALWGEKTNLAWLHGAHDCRHRGVSDHLINKLVSLSMAA